MVIHDVCVSLGQSVLDFEKKVLPNELPEVSLNLFGG